MARFEDLPLELFDSIVIKNDLPPESLAALRLCWPHIDDVVLPRLFRKLYVTFSERHLERLKNVTSSRLAPLVLELVFAVGTLQVYQAIHTMMKALRNTQKPIANILVGFLEAAVNLEELCFRSGYEGLRMTYVGEQLGRVFDSKLKLPCLKTIKLAYVPLTASGRPFQEFIKRHAATMRHVLLCHIADKIPDVVRFAATSPEIQLHRFAVLPLQFRHRSADSLRTQAEYEHLLKLRLVPSPSPPVLIAEKSLLDYINSNNPNHQDPLVDALSSDDRWGTVDQKVDRSKWPEEMYFGCKECGDP
ncbi:hypothetical protein NXS19_005041 [Fusarium pseudograminearum]|nr:hypothetical protein NXS19_005041 [Fusarium pseudograminearum]